MPSPFQPPPPPNPPNPSQPLPKPANPCPYSFPPTHSGYGFRAQQKMGAVRGRDFKREMTKAKRSGRYTGGAIDPNATFSFKYDSDDE